AFQEGRYAEARRELEQAQRMRPDDSDVLNLLGLVYFKTNAFPEAEVIYRRLVRENANVFILHSNLGLILFKQAKLEEAEQFLLRAVELRPNYAKSHLYLGLLYRQKKKYGLALEHLRFAGADKLVKEVEAEMRPAAPPQAKAPAPQPAAPAPAPPPPMQSAPPPAPEPVRVATQKIRAFTGEDGDAMRRSAMDARTQPGNIPAPAPLDARRPATPPAETAAH